MSARLLVVNFGIGRTGLTNAGYTIYNSNGTVKNARTHSGVSELGASGIFYTNASLPDNFDGIVLWDTGETSPRYGVDTSQAQLNSIQEETDHIRLIWNSIKNQGEIYAKLLNAINKYKPIKSKEYDRELAEIKKLAQEIKAKEYPKMQDIKEAVRVPAPIVNIPKVEIPDYSKAIQNIQNALLGLSDMVNRLPKEQKDYTTNIAEVGNVVQGILLKIDTMAKTFIDEVNIKLIDLSGQLNNSINSQWMKSAKKEDMEKLLKNIENFVLLFNSAHSDLSGLIKSIDNEMTSKVENGYTSAVDKRRRVLSANRMVKRINQVRLGLGIKNG